MTLNYQISETVSVNIVTDSIEQHPNETNDQGEFVFELREGDSFSIQDDFCQIGKVEYTPATMILIIQLDY